MPRFRLFPVDLSFLREYSRYSPDFSLRIIQKWMPRAGVVSPRKMPADFRDEMAFAGDEESFGVQRNADPIIRIVRFDILLTNRLINGIRNHKPNAA